MSGDRQLLAHIVYALSRYENDLRRDGFNVPNGLTRVREFAESCATLRQDATPLGDPLDLREPDDMANHPMLNKREAAAALRVSVRTVERLIASGALPVVHMGRVTRVRRTDLESYIESLGSTKLQDSIETKDTA